VSRLRSQYVTVLLAQIGGLPAVVEDEDDAQILLSLAVQAPPGFQRVLDRPVRVECVSARGIQRVTGLAAWSPEQPDQLRVTRDADDTIQRREAVRVQAVAPVVLTVLSLPPAADGPARAIPAPVKTTSLNVSTTGVLVRDPAELPMGTRVRIELELDAGEPPVALTGRIVREVKDEKGICIDDISRPDQDRLNRYVTEKQRAELRMSRS
jgi:PilZ domain